MHTPCSRCLEMEEAQFVDKESGVCTTCQEIEHTCVFDTTRPGANKFTCTCGYKSESRACPESS